MIYDTIVIGAGVAGARTAELLAKKGLNVLILENKKKVGYPVQCTGLVSSRFLKLLPKFPKKYKYNSISKARFFAPNGRSFELSSKPFTVINRLKLDEWLTKKAKKAGAELKTNIKFLDYRESKGWLAIKTNKCIFKTRILIGADGPVSAVARSAKIKATNILFGVQATARGKFDTRFADLYFGSNIAPKYFAWVVPINTRRAKIGLATHKKSSIYFRKFAEKRLGYVPQVDVGGLIKFGFQRESVAERVMLIGDSASQVKPFSGGGINYSLISAEICADATEKAIKNDNFSKAFLKETYEKNWHKILKMPIKKGLIISKLWYNAPDFAKNLFVELAGSKIIRKLMEQIDPDFY